MRHSLDVYKKVNELPSLLAYAAPVSVRDDHMIQEPESDHLCPCRQAGCRLAVGLARFDSPGRVVMGHPERCASRCQHQRQNISDRKEGAIGRAFTEHRRPQHCAGTVADHDNHPLMPQSC